MLNAIILSLCMVVIGIVPVLFGITMQNEADSRSRNDKIDY